MDEKDILQAARLPEYGLYRDGDTIVEAWRFDDQSAAAGRTHATLINADGEVAATVSSAEGLASVNTDDGAWDISAPEGGPWIITTAGGDQYTVSAADDVKKLTAAKKWDIAGPVNMTVTRETASAFVFETAAGQKLGQFTSADRAVRNPRIEFDTDEGRALDNDAKILVAFLARQLIRARTVASLTIVMWTLLFLAVLALVFWQVG